MNVSVIDIGSNTVKSTIFQISKKGRNKVLSYRGHKSKLISYVEMCDGEKRLSDEGKIKLFEAIEDLIEFGKTYSVSSYEAFATAVLRSVSNAEEILLELKERFSLSVEILSGREEALCSLRGLLTSPEAHSLRSGIMIDMGGGSTEIVLFENGKEPVITSLSFGCLSLFEGFVKGEVPTKAEEKEIANYVKRELEKADFVKSSAEPLFLIGGSARAVLKLAKRETSFTALRGDGSDFLRIINKMRDPDYYEKSKSIISGRSTTVVPGAIAYLEIIKFIKPTLITVSDSGVREGYLEKILP